MINAKFTFYRIVCMRTGRPFSDEPAEVVIDEDTDAAMWAEFGRLQAEARRLVAQHWRAIQRVVKWAVIAGIISRCGQGASDFLVSSRTDRR